MKGPTDEQIFNYMLPDDDEVEETGCFSCDKIFEVDQHNDRPEGYFCDDCLDN